MSRIVLALLVGVGLCACTRTNSALPNNDTLVVAQQREPRSLNPALENGVASMEWGTLLFSYLVKFDDRGRLIGDVALTIPTLQNGGISKDGLTITYHLRNNVRFADGTPLTARDCVWSIRAIQNPANNAQTRYGYDRIVRAEAPNDTTLVLHLREPFAPLMTLVLAPQGFPIFPSHLLAQYPNFNNVPFDAKPLGSGPYVVTNWDRSNRVEMQANPYYWQGHPKIEHLIVRFVPDANTAINLLHTHEVDGFFDDEDYNNYPLLIHVPGTYVSNEPIDGVGALIFNTHDPLTSDPQVRHALAEAINIPSLVQNAYRGALTAAQAGRGLFLWAYDPHAYPDVPYAPRAAASLLDARGWHIGPDGLRHRAGRTLDLQLILESQTPSEQIAGNVIAFYEHQIGVRVSLKQFNEMQFVAPADLGGPVYGGKFEMALYPFINGDDPDTTDQFACSHIPPNGYNKSRLCDPAIDSLLTSGRRTYDMAARKSIYVALQQLLYDELPIALLYQRRQVSAFTARLHGQSTSLSGAFWNAGRWTLSR